jgi:hypothetical protein
MPLDLHMDEKSLVLHVDEMPLVQPVENILLDNINSPRYWSARYKEGKCAVMYLCIRDIDFVSFNDFPIWFWNCSDSDECGIFLFSILILTTNIEVQNTVEILAVIQILTSCACKMYSALSSPVRGDQFGLAY